MRTVSENSTLAVQPRMGFSNQAQMREGLLAVKKSIYPAIGTITIDSFTRQLNYAAATEAIRSNKILNGYPIVSYSTSENQKLIEGVCESNFVIQVRHGCAKPKKIFDAVLDMGLDATEGGPISYCLPYGRESLKSSVKAWTECCRLFAKKSSFERPLHIESFGGCMLGQLCPPSMLIAITVLECIFMRSLGVKSMSLSYAQGSNTEQDLGAISALKLLAEEYLEQNSWHIVFYTFMGKFPLTELGSKSIIEDSARIARISGASRLIVKTAVEAHKIPTIDNNIYALGWVRSEQSSNIENDITDIYWHSETIFQQARGIIEAVLNISSDLGKAILIAFKKGYLDIPYCLHENNKKLSSAWVDYKGNIQWAETGKIPFEKHLKTTIFKQKKTLTSSDLLSMLSYNQIKYDSINNQTIDEI